MKQTYIYVVCHCMVYIILVYVAKSRQIQFESYLFKTKQLRQNISVGNYRAITTLVMWHENITIYSIETEINIEEVTTANTLKKQV